MEYDEILESTITEMTELALQHLREENGRLDKLIKRNVELSQRIETALKNMNESDWKLFQEYYDDLQEISSKEMEHLYRQGAKDCVLLLKKMSVI
ncbi:hypothetical protein A7X67_04470 [Clostridium sp. W14A]|nr:hypothetical protein A7X67_04470 [Clostridium sp. W14A]